MKYILFTLNLFLSLYTSAQTLKIGVIEIYGNRKVNSDLIYDHLGVKGGDTISLEHFKLDDVIAGLKQIPGVKYATANPVCCDTASNLLIYIGIGETDSVLIKHRKAPTQAIQLPDYMINSFRNFKDQIEPAIKSGEGTEDDTHGYALIKYQPARKEQTKFIEYARKNLTLLTNMLKNSKYAEQRAAAAMIIAYSENRKKVIDNLIYAVDDTDDEVRNNATRALGILAAYSRSHPELHITIPVEPFIKMVNSIIWTDRNKGASVLMQLSQNRDPKILNQIKQQALLSIIEMAKLKERGHAFFSFFILGRIAGVDEQSLFNKNYSKDYMSEVEAMVKQCCR